MKHFVLFLFLSIVCTARAYAQEQTVTINLKNATLSELFSAIERQTTYHFSYRKVVVDNQKDITISKSAVPVSVVLDAALVNRNLEYIIISANSIVITDKETKSKVNAGIYVKLSGVVTDEKGEPLPGAAVKAKGSEAGTITDLDGKFSIDTQVNTPLEVSFLGYEKQTITAKNNSPVNIQLELSSVQLGDAVIIAYGTSSKRALTSAVSTAPMDQIAKIASPSINNEMGGRIPGMLVTGQGGGPGIIDQISIRGGGTPLFVIDGIVRSADDYANLNPNDIESYSVLKDGQATAPYGVNGANGVIVITTKKGQEGKTSVNYSYNIIGTQPSVTPNRLSSYEIATLTNQACDNVGVNHIYSDEAVQYYQNGKSPYLYPNVSDPQYQYLKRMATEQRHDFSIIGGNKTVNYYAALSNYRQNSLIKEPVNKDYSDLTTWRLNVESKFDKIHLKVNTNIDGYINTQMTPNSGTWGGTGFTPNRQRFYYYYFIHAANASAMDKAFNEYGLPYYNAGTAVSPFSATYDGSGYGKETLNTLNGLLKADWEVPFLPGLHVIASGNYKLGFQRDKMWTASAPLYDMGSQTPKSSGTTPSLLTQQLSNTYYDLQGMIQYKGSFGKHSVGATAVAEQIYGDQQVVQAERMNYSLVFDQMIAGPTLNMIGNGSESVTNASVGYLGRFTYNYDNRYYFESTLRCDGDYRFPPHKRFGLFSGVSVGWVISDEPFIKKMNNENIINYLKLRASLGQTGDPQGKQKYYNFLYNIGASNATGSAQTTLTESSPIPGQNQTWTTTTNRNFGFDLNTLNNHLKTGFDYFYQRTTGYVATDNSTYAVTLGNSLPAVNVPMARRKEGFDFSINYNNNNNNIKGAFNYKVGFNFTYYNQLWENYNEDIVTYSDPYRRIAGYSDNYFDLGYISQGYYMNNAEILNGAHFPANTTTAAGDLKYFDANGDGKIDSYDQRKIGNSTFPHINYGLTLDLEYKGIMFDAVFMGSGNRSIILGSPINMSTISNLIFSYQTNTWSPENTNSLFPRLVPNGSNNTVTSTFWLANARYIRAKSLQVGYDLKHLKTMNKMPFSKLVLTFTARNLFTISSIMKYGVDPEQYSYNTSGYSGTVVADNNGYPLERTFAFGCNVTF